MVKSLFGLITIAAFLTSCTGLKTLYSPSATLHSPKSSNNTSLNNKQTTASKVVNDEPVVVTYIAPAPKKAESNRLKFSNILPSQKKATQTKAEVESNRSFTQLQSKYSQLLEVDPYDCVDEKLLEGVDEWYGTRYRMGGESKSGIDCSAFVRAMYLSTYGVSLPRTAREQYRTATIISSTLLQEGDLVFFNTRGGVSHVGIYLQNNKFVHASSSRGVMISSMLDSYYLQRFIGAGRIEKPPVALR